MGVYGTQTTLTTPTLDDRVVLSDAGITKSSTLQQVLDVLVPAIDPVDLSVAADDVSYDDGTNVYVTGADVQAALDAAEAAIDSAVSGSVTAVNGETGAVTLTADDIDIVDSGNKFAATDVEGTLLELFNEKLQHDGNVLNVAVLTQAAYDALGGSVVATTLYVIVG